MFKKAYNSSDLKNIAKEYEKIEEKLFDNKINEISKNKDILKQVIKEEIINRYYYKEGVYQHNLKNDNTIKEAVKLLQNQDKYKQILSAK